MMTNLYNEGHEKILIYGISFLAINMTNEPLLQTFLFKHKSKKQMK